jgi:hypothetical protein
MNTTFIKDRFTSTLTLILMAIVALPSCATSGGPVAEKLETPTHAVLERDGTFELRQYDPQIVAATTVTGDFDEASRAGFRIIANYIFGGNRPKESIAMTAPVSAEPLPTKGESIAMTAPVSAAPVDDKWRITFVMPREYTLSSLPEPNDARVSLEEQPGQCVASAQFRGWTTKAAIERETTALRAWVHDRGLVENGAVVVQRYDDPLTLPWNRRNEIHIAISNAPCPPSTIDG